MEEAFIGSIVLFAGTFAPRGWAFCDGSLLQIAQNSALYAILGTTYGGNGVQTFALPNLLGRVPVAAGNGAGQQVSLGQAGGNSSVTLTINNLPAHTHNLMVNNSAATATSPNGGVPAVTNFDDPGSGNNVTASSYAAAPNAQASPQAISSQGNSQPVNVMPPYLGLNYIICLQGIFPSRN